MASRDAVIETRFMQAGEKTEWDVWDRTARVWSNSYSQYEQFLGMMVEGRGFPNTPAIANGGKKQQCGSACFVLPIQDSLTKGSGSIAGTLMDATSVHQFGGGTGFSFGRIRPKGELVSTTGRTAPGPVSFLRGYSDWFRRVSQAGLRPAANMAILPVRHPDAMQFIRCKHVEGDIPNFNISVALDDEFMSDPDPELWTEIIEGAWANGEPGAFFIDTVNRNSLHPEWIEATNPCGEVPLLPYEACVLGSINLAAHVSVTDGVGRVNFGEIERTARQLTVMLDNIVDKQDYPLDIIRKTHQRYRKIGVGVMGYADMLVLCGLRYGSTDAIKLAKKVMEFIQQVTYDESERLATEKGPYDGHHAPGQGFYRPDAPGSLPFRRNLCCQVIAPTGTISRLAKCSFGIEPNYAAEYTSFILGQKFHDVHPLKDHPNFMTADEVDPLDHVYTQAAFQEFTDQAVSKTVNLPHNATHADVENIYRTAWELDCKGITVYREASRNEAVIVPDCKDGVCAL